MQRVDLSKPGEKKKLIAAAGLGLGAIIVLYWVLIGFGSSPPATVRPAATPTPQRTTPQVAQQPGGTVTPEVKSVEVFTEVRWETPSYEAPEARRNIFAYYEKPVVPVAAPSAPPATPEPTPPVLLAGVSPSNVYARTSDFKLEVTGDKFTSAMRIFVDGRELATSFKNPQQMSATVPASFITNPGAKSVMVRTPDNSLFSNQASLNVAPPPTPNYTYIGIISPENRVADVAVVQDRSTRNVINVYKGDVLSGRFRVTSISDKELVLTDTTLKIKHSIPMSEGDKTAGGPLSRPTPRVDAEDDEP